MEFYLCVYLYTYICLFLYLSFTVKMHRLYSNVYTHMIHVTHMFIHRLFTIFTWISREVCISEIKIGVQSSIGRTSDVITPCIITKASLCLSNEIYLCLIIENCRTPSSTNIWSQIVSLIWKIWGPVDSLTKRENSE